MTQYKLVTYGRLSEKFYDWTYKRYNGIEVRLAKSKEELKELLPDSNVYAGFNALYDVDHSHLKWIHSFGAGVDSFLQNKSLDINQTILSRTTGQLGKKIGEYCLAHVLNYYQKIDDFRKFSEEKEWKQMSTHNLYDRNVLILGTGSIGTGIANTFKGLVKSITGLNLSGNQNKSFARIIRMGDSYDNYDIIINALPETTQTKNLLDASFFTNFKNTIFINVGRGTIIESSELTNCIDLGYIEKAVLDVFEDEPLDSDSRLWDHPGIIITPHISGITTIDDVISSFSLAYDQIMQGKPGSLFVNINKGY